MRNRATRPVRIDGDLAYIPLTQGLEAIIDAADVPLVGGLNWRASRSRRKTDYAMRTAKCEDSIWRTVLMHRILLTAQDGFEVDHIDGNGLNNRRSNLRLASTSQNQHNVSRRSTNTSGFKGVYWLESKQRWRAQIMVKGLGRVHLGQFSNIADAAEAYRAGSARYHGAFARGD